MSSYLTPYKTTLKEERGYERPFEQRSLTYLPKGRPQLQHLCAVKF